MHLKGDGEDALVLTTADATYAVQLVETSNTVLPARVTAADPVPPAGAGEHVALVIEGSVGGVMQVRAQWAVQGQRPRVRARRAQLPRLNCLLCSPLPSASCTA